MRVLFVTSGLEPGRDGVGDYCRLLAEELRRQGHAAALAGLNDSFAPASRSGTPEELRLSPRRPWRSRVERLQEFIQEWQPEWISLQFVAYGFHRRGLVGSLIPGLLSAFRRIPVHLGFHELWVGIAHGSPLRQRLLGLLQRHGILRLVEHLHPSLITTTNPVYGEVLRCWAVVARQLQLFGNIPVEPNDGGQTLAHFVPAPVVAAAVRPRVLGMFGTLHRAWSPAPLLEALRVARERDGRQTDILLLGRDGLDVAALRAFTAALQPEARVLRLGELAPPVLSRVLQELDAGISTMPRQLLGKSGSAAAMLDHGLPVFVSREEHYGLGAVEDLLPDPLCRSLTRESIAALSSADRQPAGWRLPAIARQFTAMLEAAA